MPNGKPIHIHLQWFEIQTAAINAVCRCIEAKRKDAKDVHGYDGKRSWTDNIEGTAAEVAFAKYWNVYWEGGINTYKTKGDVCGVEVRWTSSDRPERFLIVRNDDPKDRVYVLVSGTAPDMYLEGWLDAAKIDWENLPKRNPGKREPAWFIDRKDLHPMSKIPPRPGVIRKNGETP